MSNHRKNQGSSTKRKPASTQKCTRDCTITELSEQKQASLPKPSNDNTPPDLDPTAWANDERFFDDSKFPLLPNQIGYRARLRAVRHDVNVLLKSECDDAFCLAGPLNECSFGSPGDRCLGGACLICGTARARAFALQAKEIFDLNNISVITIVPTEKKSQPVDLADFDIGHFRGNLAEKLNSAGLSGLPIAAALDLRRCWYLLEDKHDFWAPHWHAIVISEHAEDVASRLRNFFPPSGSVNTPIMLKRVTQAPARAVIRSFTTEFYERTVDVHPDFNGKKFRQKIVPGFPSYEPLMVALDRIGLENRVLIRRGH